MKEKTILKYDKFGKKWKLANKRVQKTYFFFKLFLRVIEMKERTGQPLTNPLEQKLGLIENKIFVTPIMYFYVRKRNGKYKKIYKKTFKEYAK